MRNLFRVLLVASILLILSIAFLRGSDRIALNSVLDLTSGGIERLPELLQRIRDFHRVVTRDGLRTLELSAKEASFFKDDRAVLVVEPKIVFFDDGRRFAVVGADRAKVYFTGVDADQVQLEGNVDFNLRRFHLSAGHLTFNRTKARIDAHGDVELTSPQMRIRGDNLHLDLATRRLSVDQRVRVRVAQTPNTSSGEEDPG